MNTSAAAASQEGTAAIAKEFWVYNSLVESGRLFWLLNVTGWIGISLVTYFSLSLPYDQFELSYLLHNVCQSCLGFALTVPMRMGFKAVWDWPIKLRIPTIVALTFLVAIAWATLRLLLFMLLTEERDLWADFGGWLFPSIFVFLTWAALYHGIKYYQLLQSQREAVLRLESQQRQRALQLVQARAETRDAQLQLLRYQLNPHFLFNTLNSVASLVDVGRSGDAKVMLGRLSDFLRFSLDAEGDAMVSLDAELNALTQYLRIEQVRFSDRLVLEFDISDDVHRLVVPNMLLQPLAENAIKYAIASSEEGGTIRIGARLEANRLVMSVEDSGPTSDPSALSRTRRDDEGSGIGLKNTRERLKNLYGNDFELGLDASVLGGCRFRISVPATESLQAGGA